MTIKKIMVIGAGQMGGGIAQVSAQAGYDTVQYDINMDLVNKGLAVIEQNLSRDVSKGKKSEEDKAAILGRIKPTVKLEDAVDCDLVIEAIVENFDIKKQVFDFYIKNYKKDYARIYSININSSNSLKAYAGG